MYALKVAWAIFLGFVHVQSAFGQISNMRCTYGERGSLTSSCVNATVSYLRSTSYRFDHLDETVQCINCNLNRITQYTFDISGNYIQFLNLSNSNISVIESYGFTGLIFMKELYLPNNHIRNIVPGTFKGIKKLERLVVSNNSLVAVQQDGFKELVLLKYLDLSNNSIETIDRYGFNGMESLETLLLNHNKLRDLSGFAYFLKTLRFLDLGYNQISELHAGEFLDFSNLMELNLTRNKLTMIRSETFLGLNKLKKLDLSSNHIMILEPRAFRGLINLEYLDLQNCQLSVIGNKVFMGTHSLKYLNLANNVFKSFTTGTFSGLPELSVFNMSNNRIETLERTGVFTLTKLHSLDISNNKLFDFKYKEIISFMPALSLINLKGNHWPCYLQKEMEEFFKEDNILFEFSPEHKTLDSCSRPTTTQQPTVIAVEKAQEQAEYVAEEIIEKHSSGGANAYVVYTFLTLAIIMIGILFFLQYKHLRAISHGYGGINEIQTAYYK